MLSKIQIFYYNHNFLLYNQLKLLFIICPLLGSMKDNIVLHTTNENKITELKLLVPGHTKIKMKGKRIRTKQELNIFDKMTWLLCMQKYIIHITNLPTEICYIIAENILNEWENDLSLYLKTDDKVPYCLTIS